MGSDMVGQSKEKSFTLSCLTVELGLSEKRRLQRGGNEKDGGRCESRYVHRELKQE